MVNIRVIFWIVFIFILFEFSIFFGRFQWSNHSRGTLWIWDGYSQIGASLTVYNLISNARSWNNTNIHDQFIFFSPIASCPTCLFLNGYFGLIVSSNVVTFNSSFLGIKIWIYRIADSIFWKFYTFKYCLRTIYQYIYLSYYLVAWSQIINCAAK